MLPCPQSPALCLSPDEAGDGESRASFQAGSELCLWRCLVPPNAHGLSKGHPGLCPGQQGCIQSSPDMVLTSASPDIQQNASAWCAGLCLGVFGCAGVCLYLLGVFGCAGVCLFGCAGVCLGVSGCFWVYLDGGSKQGQSSSQARAWGGECCTRTLGTGGRHCSGSSWTEAQFGHSSSFAKQEKHLLLVQHLSASDIPGTAPKQTVPTMKHR